MKNKIKICAHPWAYMAHQKGYDMYPILDQIFKDFKEAGFDGIELTYRVFSYNDAVKKIGSLSRKYNLPVIGSSFAGEMWDVSSHNEIMESAKHTILGLEQLGGRLLGVSTGSKPNAKKTKEEFDIQAEILRKLIKLCEDHGITLNLHNHTYEVMDNEYELKANIERIPEIKLGPDLNWLLRAGVEPIDFLRRYKNRIVYLHLRDDKAGKWPEALGEGETDFVAIGEALEEINFKGKVCIELAHEEGHVFVRSLEENFKISCQNLRKAFDL